MRFTEQEVVRAMARSGSYGMVCLVGLAVLSWGCSAAGSPGVKPATHKTAEGKQQATREVPPQSDKSGASQPSPPVDCGSKPVCIKKIRDKGGISSCKLDRHRRITADLRPGCNVPMKKGTLTVYRLFPKTKTKPEDKIGPIAPTPVGSEDPCPDRCTVRLPALSPLVPGDTVQLQYQWFCKGNTNRLIHEDTCKWPEGD